MKKITLLIALILAVASYAQTPGGGLTDIDGNVYNTVIIGTQEWTQTNFTVSKFTDGTPIPEDIPNGNGSIMAAYSCYNNDPVNCTIYGKLYNWNALVGIYDNASLNDASLRKQFAPPGWHVPSNTEWNTLINLYINSGISNNGGKLKETGTDHWITPNTYATNESGFTGLPGGQFGFGSGGYLYLGQKGFWWSSSERSGNQTGIIAGWNFALTLRYDIGGIEQTSANGTPDKKLSVRLIKNSPLNNHSFNNDSYKIYPNPAKEQITIDCSEVTNFSGLRYKIINTLGQEIIEGNISSQQNIVRLNLLKGQGIYFVKIVNEQNEVLSIKKIIIQ